MSALYVPFLMRLIFRSLSWLKVNHSRYELSAVNKGVISCRNISSLLSFLINRKLFKTQRLGNNGTPYDGEGNVGCSLLVFFREGWGSASKCGGGESTATSRPQNHSTCKALVLPLQVLIQIYQWLEENIRFRKPHTIKIYVNGADFTKFTLVKYERAWYDRKF